MYSQICLEWTFFVSSFQKKVYSKQFYLEWTLLKVDKLSLVSDSLNCTRMSLLLLLCYLSHTVRIERENGARKTKKEKESDTDDMVRFDLLVPF